MVLADNSDVFVRFGADIDPLKKGVTSARAQLKQFGSASRDTVNQLGKIGLAAGAAGIALGVKLVNGSLKAIDAQAKLAKQLGTSTTSLATLNRAAEMSGISMSSIEKGAKNLEVAMGEAAGGTGEALKTLERLNLTAQDLQGMTLDQKILTVNKAIKDNIPVTEQAAAAADLFGKKAGFAIRQLDPATIAEARREVVGFGVAVSDVDASKIERANDAMATVGLAVDGVSNQFTVALAPALEAIANQFKEAAIETGGFKNEAMQAVQIIATGMGFVGDSIKGVSILIDTAALAFQGLSLVANIVSTFIALKIDTAVQKASESINFMIDGLNNIPGIDISKLVVGKSDIAESMMASVKSAGLELEKSAAALNQSILEPLPSEKVEAFMESVYSKNNLEVMANDEKLALLAESDSIAAAEKLEAESVAAEALSAVNAAALDKRLANEKKNKKELESFNKSMEKQRTAATGNALSDLSTLMQSGSKKQFEIGKVAAKAQVVMSTYEGAQKAFTSFAGLGPWGVAAGIAAAGAAVAAGGIRLQAINSTSFGGGGGVSGGGGGAAPAAASAPAAAASAPTQDRNLVVSGIDPSSLYSGDQLTGILDGINEAIDDGYVLRVG